MRRHGRGQTNQGEVLDDSCHATSALGTLRCEGYDITLTIKPKLCFDSRMRSAVLHFPRSII